MKIYISTLALSLTLLGCLPHKNIIYFYFYKSTHKMDHVFGKNKLVLTANICHQLNLSNPYDEKYFAYILFRVNFFSTHSN